MLKYIFNIILLSMFVVGCSLSNPFNDSDKVNTNSQQNKPDTTNEPQALVETSQGKIFVEDAIWYKYVNEKFGFSMLVPQMTLRPDGACKFDTDRNEYKLSPELVPIKILEKDNNILITGAHYYTLDNGQGCKKVENITDMITGKTIHGSFTWHITVADASSDADIEQYIKQRYGEACGFGSKTFDTEKNLYRVSPKGDGKEPGESKCWFNFMTHIVYSSDKQKVVGWDLGQAFSFFGDVDANTVYDQTMVDSFKFE